MQESKNIDYAKQHHIPHCWLPAKVMYPASSIKRFSWLTRSTPNFIVEERSNIYIFMSRLKTCFVQVTETELFILIAVHICTLSLSYLR